MNDIDLLDLDRWARDGIPHDWFAEKRRDAPVWRHPGRDGEPGFWVVSGHEQVVALGRCPHAMSSDEDNGGVTGLGAGDELQELLANSFETAALDSNDDGSSKLKQLLTMDPPEHTGNRKLVNRSFTPRTIAELEPSTRALAAALLDPYCPSGRHAGEAFDFTTEVAMPLPMQVIGDLLGAPRDRHLDLLQWSNEVVATTDPEYLAGRGDDTQLICCSPDSSSSCVRQSSPVIARPARMTRRGATSYRCWPRPRSTERFSNRFASRSTCCCSPRPATRRPATR